VRLKGIEVAYDLGKERRINTELEEQRRRLHIEIGMLKDPVRVVELARDQLGMGPPDPADIIRLGRDGTLPPARASDRAGAESASSAAAARPRPAKGPATKPAAKPAVSKPATAKEAPKDTTKDSAKDTGPGAPDTEAEAE
jgi:hypothetical protein